MNKKTWGLVVGMAAVGMIIYVLFGEQHKAVAPTVTVFDPMNAVYDVNGRPIALVNGMAQEPAAPGSAAQMTTRVFGPPAIGDLNGDGRADAAVILEQDPGGSGVFYYAAAAINAPGGAEGTNAILLGDRIAPQNIAIQNGKVLVNYADRNPGEPMTTQPSLGVTKYLIYQSSTLVEATSS